VAEAKGEVVANAFVQGVPKVPRPGRFDDALGYVTNFYVRPSHRNQGLGTVLLRRVVDWARARDLETLVVWPSRRSRSLYSRAGFAPGEVREMVLRPE
jgi:GNAT superfamily N-acetyltransferase